LRTLAVLRRAGRPLLAWGGAVPAALLAAGILLPQAAGALFGLAGLGVLLTGWAMKFLLITRAGYNQGYALHRTSAAGGAGPAIRPGWAAPDNI